MSTNPYATPTATVAKDELNSISLYSPNQAAVGALLGGPVGLIYFLRGNFVSLANPSAAKKCLVYGGLLILGLIILLPMLPDKFPSAPFNVLYIFIARSVVKTYQLSKADIINSPRYEFKSNWNVIAMGLLSLVGSLLVIIIPVMLLTLSGMGRG